MINMIKIDELKFDQNGLIPAIVVDSVTKKVLTLAYMNKESGNYQHIVSITADCDNDALVILVEKDGPACHTGSDSCFTKPVFESEKRNEFSPQILFNLIEGRKTDKKEGSYTTYLFEKGIDKILKKVGEECTEVIIAGKANDKKETIYEIADLYYHVMVLMIEMGISIEDIFNELKSRHVIDKKVKQEKMTK